MNRSENPGDGELAGQSVATPLPEDPYNLAAGPEGRGGPKTPERKVYIARRRAQVATLLLTHRTYVQIADALGISQGTVADDVRNIRREWRERAAAAYDAHRSEELAKLDAIERAWLPVALQPLQDDPEHAGRAALVVHRAMERRAKLLGLDVPTRTEVTGEGGGPVQIQTVESLKARGRALVDELEEMLRREAEAEQDPRAG